MSSKTKVGTCRWCVTDDGDTDLRETALDDDGRWLCRYHFRCSVGCSGINDGPQSARSASRTASRNCKTEMAFGCDGAADYWDAIAGILWDCKEALEEYDRPVPDRFKEALDLYIAKRTVDDAEKIG